MDEPFLPWWSMLLLGLWAVALTLWLHPTVHREIRLWAGLSALVYLGLIFLALGGGPRGTASDPSSAAQHLRMTDIVLGFCMAVSLTASVWSLGRICLRSRRICYVVLTLGNASICAVMQQPEVAVGLLIVAGITARPLVREWTRQGSRSPREWLADFARFTNETIPPEHRGEFWLIGGLGGVLALVLLGTISHSLRVETSRATSSTRHTALPSGDQLDRVLDRQNNSFHESSLIELALGARADLVVLMAIIVFLQLAMSMTDPTRSWAERSAKTDALGQVDSLGQTDEW